jgi:hypothetical protein
MEEIMSAQVAQKSVKNRLAVNLRFPGEGYSTQGKSVLSRGRRE